MNLSEHFELEEMTRSNTAVRYGRKVEAPEKVVQELTRGCVTVMEPIRAGLCVKYKRTVGIDISSGYRPLWLNKLVGGSEKSDHIDGRAFDFNAWGVPTLELAEFINSIIDTLPIDKLIYEFGEWVHVSIAPVGQEPRRLVMTAVKRGRKTVYLPGIIKQET
jgi:zinc D-Ala-D-Ala carboxypeptidase